MKNVFVLVSVLFASCGAATDPASLVPTATPDVVPEATPVVDETKHDKKAVATAATVPTQNAMTISFMVATQNDLPVCEESIKSQLAYSEQDASFFVCNSTGTWKAIDLRGPAGKDGQSVIGPAGESITGPQGIDGTAGTSCSTAPTTGGVNITCGSQVTFLANGAPGQSAVGPQGPAGASVTGPQGIAGTSCSSAPTTGGVNITCGSQVTFLANGAPGQSVVGPQGPAGQDGVSGVHLVSRMVCSIPVSKPKYSTADGTNWVITGGMNLPAAYQASVTLRVVTYSDGTRHTTGTWIAMSTYFTQTIEIWEYPGENFMQYPGAFWYTAQGLHYVSGYTDADNFIVEGYNGGNTFPGWYANQIGWRSTIPLSSCLSVTY